MSLAKNFVDLLNMCLNTSEECIDSCQKVIDMCSGRDFEDCGKELGILEVKTAECVKCCKLANSRAEEYLKSCKDLNCSDLVKKFIDKSERCISQCTAAGKQCKGHTAFCISSTFECIKACKELTQIIGVLLGYNAKQV